MFIRVCIVKRMCGVWKMVCCRLLYDHTWYKCVRWSWSGVRLYQYICVCMCAYMGYTANPLLFFTPFFPFFLPPYLLSLTFSSLALLLFHTRTPPSLTFCIWADIIENGGCVYIYTWIYIRLCVRGFACVMPSHYSLKKKEAHLCLISSSSLSLFFHLFHILSLRCITATDRDLLVNDHTSRAYCAYYGQRGYDYAEIADMATRLLVCSIREAESERIFNHLGRLCGRRKKALKWGVYFTSVYIFLSPVYIYIYIYILTCLFTFVYFFSFHSYILKPLFFTKHVKFVSVISSVHINTHASSRIDICFNYPQWPLQKREFSASLIVFNALLFDKNK